MLKNSFTNLQVSGLRRKEKTDISFADCPLQVKSWGLEPFWKRTKPIDVQKNHWDIQKVKIDGNSFCIMRTVKDSDGRNTMDVFRLEELFF